MRLRLHMAYAACEQVGAANSGAPQYPGKTFPNLRAALEDGPKRFEDLMAATASRDGREIVRELFAMKGVERDELGRYFVKG